MKESMKGNNRSLIFHNNRASLFTLLFFCSSRHRDRQLIILDGNVIEFKTLHL